jgi:hypothetical protein
LRWLVYLARRLDGLPVLLVCAVRRGDPGAEREPLRRLLSGATMELIDPRPLTPAATAELIRARFGTNADDALDRVCDDASGGNPLLLRLLLDALEGDAGAPSVQRMHELGRGALVPYVAARLAGLPQACRELAQAAAVLGAHALLSDAAAVASIDLVTAADAADALVQAELLLPGPELTSFTRCCATRSACMQRRGYPETPFLRKRRMRAYRHAERSSFAGLAA